MTGFGVLAFVIAVVATVALAVMIVRYVRLVRDVDAVLARLGIEPRDRLASRSLYRGVRELERRTERVEEEAATLRTAVDEARLGVVIADRRGTVVFENPAAGRMMEGSHGDAVARNRVAQLIERVIRTGNHEEFEFDLYTPVRRVLRLRAVPLDGARGRSDAALVFIIDLTERYRVDAVRRDFIANAGHELKTPLGGLAVLAEALADADDPEVRRRLSVRLTAEANRMARLVDDFLDLAAIESLETRHNPVHVAEVLDEAAANEVVVASERGIDLVGKNPPPDVMVSGDRNHLISAVGNLLDNAVKYTSADSDAGDTVWYRGWAEDGWVYIEVEDHGLGIAPTHQERVFERFYRVDKGRSRASGGTGLGLSIVRNVASTHGGEVTLRSELGVGSTFTMRLPKLEPDAEPHPSEQ